jgi:hypothetical protein
VFSKEALIHFLTGGIQASSTAARHLFEKKRKKEKKRYGVDY